jgi:hypothetical protein
MKKTEIPEGLCYALCALSFFRARRDKRPRFKKATRLHNAAQTIPYRKEAVHMARKYIKLAREAGFKGSVLTQTQQAIH